MLLNAQTQINELRGINQSVIGVSAAMSGLASAISAEMAARAASARSSTPPVDSITTVAGATTAGYITSPVNEYGSHTGVGDSGYRLVQTGTGATLYFPGGGSHSVSGSNAEELLRQTYGLIDGGLNDTLIRTRATGGFTPRGLTLVGEEGPELVNFDRPGMVYTAGQTVSMLNGGGEVASELRQLREENQAQARAMVQLQARVTRLLERWDGDGMPETRSVTA